MPRRSIIITKPVHRCVENEADKSGAETAQEGDESRQSTEAESRPRGFDRISEMFGAEDAALYWLTTPNDALDGAEPLALLHRGELNQVEAAATGYLQGDFS